jgi:hypothetical protein|tara:strand:- start:1391 stop:1804 length:414 start_codon:yes stop_codon:yes gene_type:complete
MYAKGGMLPGYEKSVPTQTTMKTTRSSSIGGSPSQYNTIGEVVAAYNSNKISYSTAYRILSIQFALSDNDINDVLIAENRPPGTPGGGGGGGDFGGSEEPELEEQGSSEEVSQGLSDNTRFLLIGLIVTGLFIKRVM